MTRQLGDQLHVRAGLVENDPVDACHVLGDEAEQGLQASVGITRLAQLNNDTHGTTPGQ